MHAFLPPVTAQACSSYSVLSSKPVSMYCWRLASLWSVDRSVISVGLLPVSLDLRYRML